jgi:hypothetical protein
MSRSSSLETGVALGILFLFRPVQIAFMLLVAVLGGMYCWDKLITESYLDESQYEFNIIEAPFLDTLGGQWPTDFSPHFRYTWEFRNKSDLFVQSYQLNAELVRCDTLGQPIDSCDYVTRISRHVTMDLPAGRNYKTKDLLIFNEGISVPGIIRSKIWITKVVGDNDRE